MIPTVLCLFHAFIQWFLFLSSLSDEWTLEANYCFLINILLHKYPENSTKTTGKNSLSMESANIWTSCCFQRYPKPAMVRETRSIFQTTSINNIFRFLSSFAREYHMKPTFNLKSSFHDRSLYHNINMNLTKNLSSRDFLSLLINLEKYRKRMKQVLRSSWVFIHVSILFNLHPRVISGRGVSFSLQ